MSRSVKPTNEGEGISWRRALTLLQVLALSILFLPAPPSLAGDQDVISDRVTIKSKGDGGIVIDGRRYLVTDSTSIKDVSGKIITLCDLRVPSEAVVKYRIAEDGMPVCISIENKRLLEGATSLVIVDDPG